MTKFSNMGLGQLLSPGGHACDCGMRHSTDVRYLKIETGALHYLPEALCTLERKHPFVVCDANTYKAAGRQAAAILETEGIACRLFIFPESGKRMEPDEAAMGSLALAFDPACDSIISVGSGVITDCCKVLAHCASIPQIAVATAPSMDGYASNSSSMIQNRLKVSLYNASPAAILCDIDVLKRAPEHMLLAGLGDMLAKYIALCEWRISNLVTGEYYCEHIADLMRRSVHKCMAAAQGLVRRESEAVGAVTEGLVLSGIAMAFAKVSRPASGLEHYFSHIWEMMALERGLPSALHGAQVGVGTAITLGLYDKIRTITPDRDLALATRKSFNQAQYEEEMRDIFGCGADTVIEAEQTCGHQNDALRHAARLDIITTRWPDILSIINEELPATEEVIGCMQALSMPIKPKDLGISAQDTRRAFIGSRMIRDKYLTSSMLWDLGLLHTYAEALENSYH